MAHSTTLSLLSLDELCINTIRSVRATGKDAFAVGTEANAPHPVSVPLKGVCLLASVHVKDSRRLVHASGEDAFAVGAEANASQRAGGPLEYKAPGASVSVP